MENTKSDSCSRKTYAAIYSGGKDGHLAMLKAIQAGNKISCRITIDGGDRHSRFFHDLRKTEIIGIHADRMNIPLVICPLMPKMRQGKKGTAEILSCISEIAAKKHSFDGLCTGAADGDDDGSADSFREAGITAGIDVITPLSRLTVLDILRQQEKYGIRAIIIAAEKGTLPESLLGTETGTKFADILEKLKKRGINADGNDFQTLVTDSPLFSSPAEIICNGIIRDMERAYIKITCPSRISGGTKERLP